VEEIVAEAIQGRRDEVFLVSKVSPQNASWKGTLAACERSLGRLKTDRLDCYLLHWRGRHPLEDTIGAFNELVAAGKILAWGVSNFDVDDLAEAERIAGPGAIACNQVLYHLHERDIEAGVIPWCEAHEVAVVGYTPFGVGGLPGADSAGGRVLAEIAAAHNATPRQVILAFLVRRESLFAIPKAADPHHVAENAAASELRLTASEIARIDAAFPLREGVAPEIRWRVIDPNSPGPKGAAAWSRDAFTLASIAARQNCPRHPAPALVSERSRRA
jgi:diketogulonate reductase-like aldo/keto reductase